MDDEKKALMKMVVEHRSYLDNISSTIMNVKRMPKPASRSEEVRKEGNDLYSRRDHDSETHIEIFNHYCKSISLAPLESEVLAQACANRSALLLHIQKYEDSVKDIDRTLKSTKSDVLAVELLCRKVECMKKMGLSNYQDVLDAAENYAEKLDKKDKAQVDKFIKKAKACSVSNEKISKNQDNILPKMGDTLDCISIEHNEKYGRHVIAKKDYNPGDFIFSDNLYVAVLNPGMNYTNCNYCLKICWSGIACDYCSWAMFCDEDCKRKAWNEFHDVECAVIFYLKNSLSALFVSIQVSLRILLTGIREAGGIDKLRERLKLVDHCTDIRKKGFYKNEKFSSCSIESAYSLKSSGLSESNLDVFASAALVVLIALVKHSHLMKNFDFENVDDLMTNEDLVFLGSLLIKFTAITNFNSHSITQKSCHCKRLKSIDDDDDNNSCCARGGCLASLVSLMNHSCNPNASMIFSEDKKITIFASQPIRKNSQIFITYVGLYQSKPMKVRKEKLDKYHFTCECEACVGSWPPLSILPESDLPVGSALETKLYNDCINIFAALDAKKIDKKDIKKLCKTIVQAKRLREPTLMSGILRDAHGEIYSRVYGWTRPIYAFGLCS